MFNKKAVTVIVAMSLLLVVAVTGFIFFQNWFYDYESKIFSNVDSSPDAFSSESEIVKVISNSLYFSNAYDELEVESVYLNSVDCNISMNLSSGLQVIPLDSCIGDFSDREVTVEVVTDKYVFSRNIYINELSSKALSSNDGIFDCKSLSPFGFNGGDGSESNPFEICSCLQLQEIEEDYGANYELVSDIDCSDTVNWNEGDGFSPVGNCGEGCIGLSGFLNGNGFTIYDLFINRPSEEWVGLIGVLDGGSVLNFGVESNVVGERYVGGLIGYMYDGVIDNSYSISTVSGSEGSSVGGLVGRIYSYGSVDNSYSISSVSGGDDVGGLIGSIYSEESFISVNNSYSISSVQGDYKLGGLVGDMGYGFINNSYSISTVNGTDTYVGGLVGYTSYASLIDNSYSISTVVGVDSVGGLVGELYDDSIINNSYSISTVIGDGRVGGLIGDIYDSDSIASNSYSISTVTGNTEVGGFTGYISSGSSIENSYTVSNVSASEDVGGLVGYVGDGSVDNSYWNQDLYATSEGGIGLTTSQMKDENNYVGWDFTDVWDIKSYLNSGYPFLKNVFESSIDCDINGQEVLNGSSITLYDSMYVTDLGDCSSFERVCEYGVLSGDNSYVYDTCTMDCSYGDSEILNGETLITYLTSSVPFETLCQSDEKSCADGVVSGDNSYNFLSCSPLPGESCFLESVIGHGITIDSYLDSLVPFGETCSVSVSRNCYDGFLDGDSNYASRSCNFAYVGFNDVLKDVGHFSTVRDFYPDGEIMYIVSDDGYLSVWNVSDFSFPVMLGEGVDDSNIGYSNDIKVRDGLAYVISDSRDAFSIWNVTDFSNIIMLDEYISSFYLDNVKNFEISGNYVYTTSYTDDQIAFWNIDDPTNILPINYSYGFDGSQDIEVVGTTAYVVSYIGDSLSINDVSNFASVSRYSNTVSSNFDGAKDIEISDNYAFIASYNSDLISIYDISNPSSPSFISTFGNFDSLESPISIEIVGDFAYVSTFYNSLTVWNVSDVDDVQFLQTYDDVGIASRIKVDGDNIYVSSGDAVSVYDIFRDDFDGCYLYDDIVAIENGETVFAFLDSVVPNGGACQNITRTCSGGTFDGDSSYIRSSCVSIPFAGGLGTYEIPYQISNCVQLQAIDSYLDSSFILTNNIDCSDTINWDGGKGFNQIGDSDFGYTGMFSGNNFSINDLYINRSEDYVALFRSLKNGGEVYDLNVYSTIIGNTFVGAVFGYVQEEVFINNIYSNGSVTGGNFVGGVFGLSNSCATINNVTSDAVVPEGEGNFGQIFGDESSCE